MGFRYIRYYAIQCNTTEGQNKVMTFVLTLLEKYKI